MVAPAGSGPSFPGEPEAEKSQGQEQGKDREKGQSLGVSGSFEGESFRFIWFGMQVRPLVELADWAVVQCKALISDVERWIRAPLKRAHLAIQILHL